MVHKANVTEISNATTNPSFHAKRKQEGLFNVYDIRKEKRQKHE